MFLETQIPQSTVNVDINEPEILTINKIRLFLIYVDFIY